MAVRKPVGVPLGDHIARVAGELFYREGIHLVGVDRVAAEADVTKRTLYRYFRSKDDLVAAALRRAPRISFPREGGAAERIAGAFGMMIEFVRRNAYRGCPYIIASAELSDPRHPARAVVRELAEKRRAWFRDRAAEAGASDPELLAEQLDVLFDGGLASATKRGESAPAEAALVAAEALLAQSRARLPVSA
jgi:AcrR family transcriptional regulator